MSGWRHADEPDATEQRRSETPNPRSISVPPSRLAFYPLTMPLTTGPGTISVAISIGASRPSGFHPPLLEFFVETLAAVALLVALVYAFYRNAGRLADLVGPDRNHHRGAALRVSAVLHRHPGVLEWRGGTPGLTGGGHGGRGQWITPTAGKFQHIRHSASIAGIHRKSMSALSRCE